MASILTILHNTPWPVWLLLAVIVLLGVQGMRSRVLSVWRLLVTPVIFIGWGLFSLALQALSSPWLITDWLIAATVVATIAWMTTDLAAARMDRTRQRVSLPGSPFPLIRNLLIFAAQYGFGVAMALAPASHGKLVIWSIAVSGASAGYFLGWMIHFASIYRRPPVSGVVAEAQPQRREPLGVNSVHPLTLIGDAHVAKGTLLAVSILAASSVLLGMTPLHAQDTSIGRTLVERYVAAFNNHDVSALADVIAEKYLQHNGRAGQGLAGTQATIKSYFETFPDMHMQLEDTIISGDKVVARITLTATHTRSVQLGPGALVFQPTGKKLSWGDIDIWRVADGKFVEHWDQSDLLGLARQMRGD
jgi:predicted ester cyclase